MIRTTVLCVFAVMSVGLFVSSAGTSVPAVPSTPAVPPSSAVPPAVHSSSAVPPAVHSSSAVPPAVHSSSAVPPAIHSSSADPSVVPSAVPSSPAAPSSPVALSSLSAPSSPVVPSPVVPSSPVLSSPVVPSSPVVHVTSNAATPTPSLPSVSSQVLISSAAPVQTSHVAIVSASPTVLPVTETITIKNNKNETCLSALLDVTFIVKYESKVNINTTIPKDAHVPLNGKMLNEVGGSCNGNVSAEFHLSWNEHGKQTPRHKFSMSFTNNITSKHWAVTTINATFYTDDSPPFMNATHDVINGTSQNSNIGAKDNVTYLCNSQNKIKMGSVTTVFNKLVLQPFSKEKLKTEGTHCPGDEGSDDNDDNTVPIAVGAALGGLVLIVLVAYIVGRRRSTRGYEQV